jgi:MshEN domain
MSELQSPRMGELLVTAGVLTAQQVNDILEQQRDCGRPFGDLAERMFGIKPEVVEKAWIEQYLTFQTEVDLETQRIDVEVLRVLNRRQAWQFHLLPIRRENDELIVATSRQRLPRAVNFAWRRLHDPVFFLIAQRPQLEHFLMQHYPWPAMETPPAQQPIA